MRSAALIRNYASILFENASVKGIEYKVLTQLQAISQYINDNKECKSLLHAPIVSVTNKLRITQIIAEQFLAHNLVHRFLEVLINNLRIHMLSDIVLHYYWLSNNHKNIKKVLVTTARPLENEDKQMIANYVIEILNCDVDITFSHDASIIGGIVVQHDCHLLDYSIAGALSIIRKNFTAARGKA